MAEKIQAWKAKDGSVHATEQSADRHDLEVAYQEKRSHIESAILDIKFSLSDDHPTQPYRKGGDAWVRHMVEIVMQDWQYIRLLHEHFKKIDAAYEGR